MENITPLNINPLSCPNLKCHNCGNEIFIQKFIIKQISGLKIGTGAQNALSPMPIFVCDKCGTPTEDAIKLFKLSKDEDTSV